MRVIGLVLLAMGLLALASRPKQIFHHNDLKVEFETKQGRFDGRYTSFYANGKKMASGKFAFNQRIGIWTIWDSTGKVVMQRDYETPFEYSIKYPELPKSKSIELFSKITFNYTPGVDGYTEYYFTQDNSVLEAHRVWRELNPENNRMLFQGFDLWDVLMEGLSKKAITAYSPKDDEFREELTTYPDTTNKKLKCYKMKEDFYFERERWMRKYNVIGICPVVIDTITGETTDLCWFYYPELRPLLATRKIADNPFSEYIKSWDDYFFYHAHVAPIYAVDSKMLEASSENSVTLDEAKLEAELELIEFEHRSWLRMYGQRLD